MIFLDNLKMLNCLNDTGLNKVHELLKGLLENEEYAQISLEQLEIENEESSEQRNIQWKKEEEERKLKKETRNHQIKQQYEKELSIIGRQHLPINQLELLYAIDDLEDGKAMTLCKVYLWGYTQGKRDERARRKKINLIEDGSNIPIATLKQIIINRIKSIYDLRTLQDVYSPLVAKDKGDKPMNIVKSFNDSSKCLKCGTYHNPTINNCPVCGRYLYMCGSVYLHNVINKK